MNPIDYAEYSQLHFRGLRGEETIVSSNTIQHIHNSYEGFSLGVWNVSRFGKAFSNFDGSAGTFFCRSVIIPDLDVGFIIMTHAGSAKERMAAVEWITRQISRTLI